jgi:C1A family cysteine protease
MKIQRKHRTLTGISTLLLVVMLSSHLFTGLLPTVMAQSADQESTLQPPSSLVNDPTNTVEETQQPGDPSVTPQPVEPQPTESPVVTPEETPTGETPVGPEPVQTLEPTQAVTLEPTPEEEKVEERDPSLLTWSLQMDLPVPSDQVQSMGGTDQAGVRLLSALDSRVTDEDIEIEMIGTASSEAGTTYRVELDGSSTPQEFRYLLFASLGTDFDLLGGPIELVVSGTVTSGQAVNLFLETRPATGYTWTVTGYDPALIAIQSQPETESKASTPGASALESLSFLALADGETSFRLAYQRSFDTGESVTRRLAIQSLQMPTDLDLSSPLPALDAPPPALPGPDESLQALQTAPMVAALPSSFDWRSQGKVPAVRDQGSCGSCWAFGTAGVMETALRVQKNISVDISEQYLISCNNNGWGCGGGWWAHDLHTNTSGKYNNPPGAVLEGDFPYSNSNGTCSKVYNHPYRLAEWRYVSGINVPSVDAIKAAIYNYGPVAVSVCSIGWGNYTGGVYSTNNTSCSGGVDHAVILVGWNDADQTWILRNSWGSRWGESGYMRIRWGTSNVGYGASYVITNNSTPTPTPAPSAPRNDDISNAVGPANPGGKITFKETINVAGATRASDDPTFPFSSGAITGESTVWYRFSTVNKGTLTLTTANSTYDTVMGVFTGSRGALTRVKWNDNANSDVKTSRISFAAAANTTYYINVASKKGPGKNLTFSLTFTPPKPPNNAVTYAVKIPYTTSGANYAEIRDIWSATTVSTDPKFPLSTGATAGYRTVWYTIRPTASGTLKVNTTGSNFDTLLGVFRGSTRLSWDDNSGGNNTSSLQIRLAGQVTYRIMVSSKTKPKESRMQLNVMYLPDTPVSSGAYDNLNPAAAFVGSWNPVDKTGAFENTIHQVTKTQSLANLTFTGTGVDFLYTRQPGGGKVNIYIDGKLITSLSQAASTTQYQRKWSSATLKNGVHNIVIISTTSGPTNVDAFIVRP